MNSPSVPFAGTTGWHYHIAIQLDQQRQFPEAAKNYLAAAEASGPGRTRDFCILRYRQLMIGGGN